MRTATMTTVAAALLAAQAALGADWRLADGSRLNWSATKVGGGHEGTVDFSGGSVTTEGGNLTGGSFTIDMTTIGSTDVSGSSKKNLDDHLKSGDFFAVSEHPTARFVVVGSKRTKGAADGPSEHEVTGDLTIRGRTHRETLTVSLAPAGDGTLAAKGSLAFDRARYDVRYNSGSFFKDLGDKLIHDEVRLEFDVRARAASPAGGGNGG